MVDLKSNQIASASPAIFTQGVTESLDRDGQYGEYDVQISVTFSPRSASVATVATKTVRMSAKKFALFREETNLWDGKKFLEEYFPEELKQALDNEPAQNRPQVFVVNSQTGEVSDGQGPAGHVNGGKPAVSSVDTTTVPSYITDKADQRSAPAKPKESDYVGPSGGAEQSEGNIGAYSYEDVLKQNEQVTKEMQRTTDPQEPEQPVPTDARKGAPEQEGTDTAEQPKAAARVAAVQGGDTAATKASRENSPQEPNYTSTPDNPTTETKSLQEQAEVAAKVDNPSGKSKKASK